MATCHYEILMGYGELNSYANKSLQNVTPEILVVIAQTADKGSGVMPLVSCANKLSCPSLTCMQTKSIEILFKLMLYVPAYTISAMWDAFLSSWVEPVLNRG